jgi:hypothetical protein
MADAQRLAESCRVIFDLERIRANIETGLTGEHVTPGDVHDWLEALGFFRAPDGLAWIGRRKTLRHFAKGEVVRFEDVQ